MKTILGIFRSACYSPGMVDRDEAILRAVAKRLQDAGYAVSLIHEEELTSDIPMPDIVLHMARSSRALNILHSWQQTGCRVINSVEGVRSVERASLAKLCSTLSIPTPNTWIVDTAHHTTQDIPNVDGQFESIPFPCWVKRTGDCAQQADDVCLVSDVEAYHQCLDTFHARGIRRAVVMEHLEGPCIKFYAVRDTGFFYWLPASKLGYDKFASSNRLEVPTAKDITEGLDFQFPLPNIPLDVYGGDAIIASDGTARLIDLNDWPSFSACRDEASEAIARMVMNIQ